MKSINRNSELIDHIRQALQKHEEPYVPGAWESFQQHQKSRSKGAPVWKIAMSAAASLLLLVSLLYIIEQNQNPSVSGTPLADIEQQDAGKSESPSVTDNHKDNAAPQLPSGRTESARTRSAASEPDFPGTFAGNQPEKKASAATALISIPESDTNFRKLHPVLINKETLFGSGGLQPAAKHAGTGAHGRFESVQQINPAADRVVERRVQGQQFRFGLTYVPLINRNSTGTEWNMGGGFHTEWSFTRDFAITSGVMVAQNQLEFDQELPMQTLNSEQVSAAYLQADLLSMEIPFSLQYSLTDNVSISAGISSLAYLREQYDYTYEIQREIQVMTFTENSGYELETTTVTVTEKEHQSEESFNAIDWAGFYTLSVSYKYDLSRRYSLALEPFMKLPSGPLTSRDLKYYTGGLQMKVSF